MGMTDANGTARLSRQAEETFHLKGHASLREVIIQEDIPIGRPDTDLFCNLEGNRLGRSPAVNVIKPPLPYFFHHDGHFIRPRRKIGAHVIVDTFYPLYFFNVTLKGPPDLSTAHTC